MVAYDILQEALDGSNKTNLVYQCNLNFKIIKRWLSKLMDKGLLEFKESPSKTWTTTTRGLMFMSAMNRVKMIWVVD